MVSATDTEIDTAWLKSELTRLRGLLAEQLTAVAGGNAHAGALLECTFQQMRSLATVLQFTNAHQGVKSGEYADFERWYRGTPADTPKNASEALEAAQQPISRGAGPCGVPGTPHGQHRGTGEQSGILSALQTTAAPGAGQAQRRTSAGGGRGVQ